MKSLGLRFFGRAYLHRTTFSSPFIFRRLIIYLTMFFNLMKAMIASFRSRCLRCGPDRDLDLSIHKLQVMTVHSKIRCDTALEKGFSLPLPLTPIRHGLRHLPQREGHAHSILWWAKPPTHHPSTRTEGRCVTAPPKRKVSAPLPPINEAALTIKLMDRLSAPSPAAMVALVALPTTVKESLP